MAKKSQNEPINIVAPQEKFRVPIPETLHQGDRVRVGMDIISHIQKKAINENKGYSKKLRRYRKFPKYSPQYAKKKRSSISDVNLILTGEMFNRMLILKEKKGSLTIGFSDSGSEANKKAYINRIGAYVNKSGDSSKARPFLGITKMALLDIVRNVREEGRARDAG